MPDNESQYAAEGTVAHHLTEIMRRDGIPVADFLDQTVDDIPVTKEMVEAVEMFVEHVEETPGMRLSRSGCTTTSGFQPGSAPSTTPDSPW